MTLESKLNSYKGKIEAFKNQINDNAKNLDQLRHEQLFSKKVLDRVEVKYLKKESKTLS